MGLNVNSAPKAGDKPVKPAQSKVQEAPEIAKPPEKVLLTMATYDKHLKRFVYQDHLYEHGIVYSFKPEGAAIMLRLQNDKGIPIFIRYVAPKPKPLVAEPEIAAGATVVAAPVEIDEVADKGLKPVPRLPNQRIDAGTDEELGEFLGGIESGDLTSADLAEGGGTKV